MKAYLINIHLLVPRSRSSPKVKVKYKGYISQKMAVSWAFMFHKHILLISIFESCYENKLELNIENCLKSKLCTVHISSVIPMKLPSFENLIGKGLIGGFCFNSVCLISQVFAIFSSPICEENTKSR